MAEVDIRPSRLLAATLPQELFETIVGFLDLKSLKNLRLTSKSVASACLGRSFLSYVATQRTDLSALSLQRLQTLAEHPVLGPTVKHIVVNPVFIDTKAHAWMFNAIPADMKHKISATEMESAMLTNQHEQYMNWLLTGATPRLAKVLRQLATLDSLVLKTKVPIPLRSPRIYDFYHLAQDWYGLWSHCHKTTTTVLSAVAQSQAHVRRLSLFNDDEHTAKENKSRAEGRLTGNNLSMIADSLESQSFHTAGSQIRTLHLYFSTYTPASTVVPSAPNKMTRPLCQTISTSDPRSRNPSEFPGVARFLALTPNLNDLTLSMYNTLDGKPSAYAEVFDMVAKDIHLPQLQRLSLRGLWVNEAALLRFLNAHKAHLQTIDLREIHMPASFDRVFRCIKEMPLLKELHLENLFSRMSLVDLVPQEDRFDDHKRGKGRSYQMKGEAGAHLVYCRDIGVEEIQAGLNFQPATARAKTEKLFLWWNKQRKIVYGPPAQRR